MVMNSPPFNMKTHNAKNIWIIGAGRFGQLAARRICKTWPQCTVTLIDPVKIPAMNECRAGFRQVQMDGIAFLVQELGTENDPDWIVPAAPVHVAYEWMQSKLSGRFAIEPVTIPASAMEHLPNPQPGGPGTLYVSNATWICPDDCPEPADHCTFTKEAHSCIVYRELRNLSSDGFESIVIRSHQLLPGVGGYTPSALVDALDRVRTSRSTLLLSTACRCHAVLNAFQLKTLER
jgi:hypothetical protein